MFACVYVCVCVCVCVCVFVCVCVCVCVCFVCLFDLTCVHPEVILHVYAKAQLILSVCVIEREKCDCEWVRG